MVAGALAFLVSFLGTPMLIKILRARRLAQAIRESGEFNYPAHEGKRGTPSMGGLAIVAAVLVGYLGTHALWQRGLSASGVLALGLMLGLASVGVVDDYLKIFKRRSTGLRARTKLIGQATIAVGFALLAQRFPDSRGWTPVSSAQRTPSISPTVSMAWPPALRCSPSPRTPSSRSGSTVRVALW